jgi:hypothetical protein
MLTDLKANNILIDLECEDDVDVLLKVSEEIIREMTSLPGTGHDAEAPLSVSHACLSWPLADRESFKISIIDLGVCKSPQDKTV